MTTHRPLPAVIKPGLRGEAGSTVCEHNVAGHVAVFSTPSLVGLVERAAVAAVQPHLPEGQTTVGYEVSVRHLAPTPIGMRVRAVAELLEVQGNKLLFKVEAFDQERKIGDGTHRRAVVSAGFDKQK